MAGMGKERMVETPKDAMTSGKYLDGDTV